MRKLLPVLAVLALAGCATGNAQKANASTPFCMPCANPCLSPDSCEQVKPKPPVVKLDPPPGYYSESKLVTLSSAPGAAIHYTTDGSEPTEASPVYTAPIPVGASTTVKALAIAPGLPRGEVVSGDYTIAVPAAEAPAAPAAPPAPARVTVGEKKLELKEKVFFDTGKSTIKPESDSLLDEVAAVLNDHPEVKGIQIEGHTDNTGSVALNKKLSKGRAEAVKAYLVKKGVAPDRLTAKGFGPTRPIAPNKTAKGREENRRVEFVITSR